MSIYFAGSIRGGRQDQEIYFALIKELGKYGTVFTEHIGDKNLSSYGETDITDVQIFERDMDWLRSSDTIVAEVTTTSLGVGYEIGQARALGKRVICLYRKTEGKRLSAMLTGDVGIENITYTGLEEAPQIFAKLFAK